MESPQAREKDYECFVRQVLQDFDDRVFAVQKRAEESRRAYEAYCGEMKAQLEELKLENEALKRRVGTADANALELLSAMTSLCVCSVSSGPHQSYSCTVIEGVLKGHTFVLTLDQGTREYTYDPEGSSVTNLQQVAADFSCVIFFPEHMLSRFLINLLHASYVTHD